MDAFTDHIIASENRLLSVVKTLHVVEGVNIGSGPPGSKLRWFCSASNEDKFINTVSFRSKEEEASMNDCHGSWLCMVYLSQGFFFMNFDTFASRFKVFAIDQLGYDFWVFGGRFNQV